MGFLNALTGEAIKTAINPYKWALYLTLVIVVIAGYIHHRNSLIELGDKAGAARVQAQWDEAVKLAKEAQSKANTEATNEAVKVVTQEKIIYKDRLKKVVQYVPSKETGPCIADAEFIRLFNNTKSTPSSRTPISE